MSQSNNGRALIFGVTGQAGSYLSEHLLSLGYTVFGVARRTSLPTDARIQHLRGHSRFHLLQGDVTDGHSVFRTIRSVLPDEIYNLSAQSHVGVSFEQPELTWEVTATGVLNILEGIRCERPQAYFFQASTSEMYGSNWSVWAGDREEHSGGDCPPEAFQDELTPFRPNSPYAAAKLAGHNLVRIYRESYGLFACCGIQFNFESPRRGHEFVTRKITRAIARQKTEGPDSKLLLGNLSAKRDWSHAADTVRAMHAMLQHTEPDDYVVASGNTCSVQDFLDRAIVIAKDRYNLEVNWDVDPKLYRPCEVAYLRGCSEKARGVLGWSPTISFDQLIEEMIEWDIKNYGGLV